jgi:hypothetical protein
MMHKVRYRGSASSVGVLGSLLRDEGLRAEHREIAERQAVQQDLVDIVVYVYDPDVDGSLGTRCDALVMSGIESAIAKLRVSVPRAQAQIVATRTSSPQV